MFKTNEHLLGNFLDIGFLHTTVFEDHFDKLFMFLFDTGRAFPICNFLIIYIAMGFS